MTIDEAIRIAERQKAKTFRPWKDYAEMESFYSLCAAALRLAKAMNEVYGLEEQHD